MRAPLRARFKYLPTSDMKEILLQRMLEENYDKGHAVHRVAYEALQDSIRPNECEDFDVDKAQEETKKKSHLGLLHNGALFMLSHPPPNLHPLSLIRGRIGIPASLSNEEAGFYPDVGLEQLVPDQFWIEEECKYDIAAMYGISHWWFQRQRFYIDRFS
ncbi:hypothetical protein Tco_0099563 [Tanacetum coccineum]